MKSNLMLVFVILATIAITIFVFKLYVFEGG